MGCLAPHDLLWLRDPAGLVSEAPRPAWVADALAFVPLVVVRRAPRVAGRIPVGVRGPTRAARWAAWLPPGAIAGRIAPEDLAARRGWAEGSRPEAIRALRALDLVAVWLDRLDVAWGPIGAVGFELASGVPSATPASDLDLVLRAPRPLPHVAARRLLDSLDGAPARLDIQVETPAGAVALAELARGSPRTLLRTRNGPRLVADPWAVAPDLQGAP